MEGYLSITPPKSGLANCDLVPLVVTSVSRFTIQWHLWAATSFPQPNVCVPFVIYSHVTLPVVFTPSSVDALVDVHGRIHNFQLIHLREVLLTGHWVTALPIFSCGIISVSPIVEVGLYGVGLVHLSNA